MPLSRVPRSARRSALALLAVAMLAACSPAPSPDPAPVSRPVLLIGVDGLEWSVLEPLLEDGKLPALAGLIERGTSGRLRTMAPTESPIIWTTIATGKLPEEHGILAFARRDEEGAAHLYSQLDRRVKALWNILSDRGRRTWVLGWWMTYPVEPIEGVMVAQTNTLDQLDIQRGRHVWKGRLRQGVSKQVFPPSLEPEVFSVLEAVDGELPELERAVFGELPHPLHALGSNLLASSEWAFRADTTYFRVARALVERRPLPDLAMIYFGGTDVVGHYFWRYRHPELYKHPPSDEELENFGDFIEDYYIYVDRMIGELLIAWGEEADVFVVSDHGMRAYRRPAFWDRDRPPRVVNSGHHQHKEPGVLIAAGPSIRHRPRETPEPDAEGALPAPVGTVLDITPTLLALLGIPVGRDMEGQVLSELLAPDGPGARVAWVESHETGERAARPAETGLSAEAERERLEQLRSLGYLSDGEDE